MLVAIPNHKDIKVFDEYNQDILDTILTPPQLVVLGSHDCLQVETHGTVIQSNFRKGYHLTSNGSLQPVAPSFGRPDKNHQWAFFRIQTGEEITFLTITPDQLLIRPADFEDLKARVAPKEEPPRNATKKDANHQRRGRRRLRMPLTDQATPRQRPTMTSATALLARRSPILGLKPSIEDQTMRLKVKS